MLDTYILVISADVDIIMVIHQENHCSASRLDLPIAGKNSVSLLSMLSVDGNHGEIYFIVSGFLRHLGNIYSY